LRDNYEAIRATGADLWVIANDDPDKLRELRDAEGLDFPILLDPEATTIQGWGLLNDMDSRGRMIPHPTVAIVDGGGIVRYFSIETNYRLRPPTADLVERLARLGDEEQPGAEAR
jgi:peroxiredoxin